MCPVASRPQELGMGCPRGPVPLCVCEALWRCQIGLELHLVILLGRGSRNEHI